MASPQFMTEHGRPMLSNATWKISEGAPAPAAAERAYDSTPKWPAAAASITAGSDAAASPSSGAAPARDDSAARGASMGHRRREGAALRREEVPHPSLWCGTDTTESDASSADDAIEK